MVNKQRVTNKPTTEEKQFLHKFIALELKNAIHDHVDECFNLVDIGKMKLDVYALITPIVNT